MIAVLGLSATVKVIVFKSCGELSLATYKFLGEHEPKAVLLFYCQQLTMRAFLSMLS